MQGNVKADDQDQENPDENDWAKINRTRKQKAGLFVCLPDLQMQLVISGIALIPGMSLLYLCFKLGQNDFETEQQRQSARGHGLTRTFRVLEAARLGLIQPCFEQVSEIMRTHSPALPERFYNFKSRSMLFRMLSSFLCCIHASVRRYHSGFPYRLFRILESRHRAKEVYAASSCFWDELATEFFTKYPTVDEGLSKGALAYLQSLALVVDIDPCHFTWKFSWKFS